MKNALISALLISFLSFVIGVITGAAMLSVAVGAHIKIEPSKTLDSRDLIRLP